MTSKLNLHRLMAADAGFLHALSVDEADRRQLSRAREMIRSTIRTAFGDWTRFVRRAELFEGGAVASADLRLPRPKFRMQGSFKYHTVNDCQDPPSQQIDQDDGVFMPLSFVLVQGAARPTVASRAYFAIVERSLEPLCRAEGWTLNPTRKGSCVRVEIDDRLHIDLPLYAIRDEAFDRLEEVALESAFAGADWIAKRATEDDAIDERVYRQLASAEIMLAHREQGWIESDPRKLEDWFENAVDILGPAVRELSRCFKGMRDARLDQGLSSIAIMACVVAACESIADLDDKRLDLSLARTARLISRRLADPVDNPAFPGDADKRLCKDWTPEYRKRIGDLFEDVAARMEAATDGTFHKGLALAEARRAFGPRIPADEDLITLGATVAATVRSVPAKPQPRPTVPRTRSG